MKCPHCNATIKKSKFCSECGKKIETGLTQDQEKILKTRKKIHNVSSTLDGVSSLFSGANGTIWIVVGIILTLTGIGAIIGIPLIILGAIWLKSSKKNSKSSKEHGEKAEEIEDKLYGIK